MDDFNSLRGKYYFDYFENQEERILKYVFRNCKKFWYMA